LAAFLQQLNKEDFMKNCIFALTLVLAAFSSAHAAEDLVTYHVYNGFMMPPDRPQVWTSIQDDGQVIKHTRDAKVNRQSKTVLATLSPEILAAVKNTVQTVDENIQLYDTAPKAPKCADAGGSTVIAHKNGKEIKIYATGDCHEYVVREYLVKEVARLITSFYSLGQR
jgi:hypothetical protein